MYPSFICDSMLGKLSRYLRILGIDCLYQKEWDKEKMIDISNKEKRIILTRDLTIIARRDTKYYFFIDMDNPKEQIFKVVKAFSLTDQNLGKRCPVCNELLIRVSKDEIKEKLWPYVFKKYHLFHLCVPCNRIYWKGSHIDRFIEDIIKTL